jgi:hypothetical protein
MSTFNRKIGATLAGTAFAATAVLTGVPAATADVAQQSYGEHSGYTLILKSIDCFGTEDSDGRDEAYIRVDGYKVWGPEDMESGDSHKINEKFDFDRSAQVSLWDKDGHKRRNDDYLGHFDVKKRYAEDSWRYAKFNYNGADYVLKYKVVKN